MQQRIQNAFSNNTQTNTDAPSRDELLNDLDRRRTAIENDLAPNRELRAQLNRERDELSRSRIYGSKYYDNEWAKTEKKIQALDD